MLLFRSLTLGLLGACFLLIASRPTIEIRRCPMEKPTLQRGAVIAGDGVVLPGTRGEVLVAGMPAMMSPISLPPAVVDVAPGVTAAQLASLVRLDEGEHIASIDDLAVSGDVGAGVQLAKLDLTSRRYIDLGVEGPRGTRRILVLLH